MQPLSQPWGCLLGWGDWPRLRDAPPVPGPTAWPLAPACKGGEIPQMSLTMGQGAPTWLSGVFPPREPVFNPIPTRARPSTPPSPGPRGRTAMPAPAGAATRAHARTRPSTRHPHACLGAAPHHPNLLVFNKPDSPCHRSPPPEHTTSAQPRAGDKVAWESQEQEGEPGSSGRRRCNPWLRTRLDLLLPTWRARSPPSPRGNPAQSSPPPPCSSHKLCSSPRAGRERGEVLVSSLHSPGKAAPQSHTATAFPQSPVHEERVSIQKGLGSATQPFWG